MFKKKIFVLLTIVVLAIIYSGLFYYYVKEDEEDSQNTKTITKTTTDTVTLDKITNFMDEYNINYLDAFNSTFKNSNDIINQIKLKYVYYAIKENANFSLGVSYTRFNSYLKSVFGKNIILKNEDILYDNTEKSIYLKYDASNETYIYATASDNLGDIYYSRYNYIVSYKNSDGNYKLAVNKFFVKGNKVYPTYGDLINDINVLFEIPVELDDMDTYIKNYVNQNYSTLKSKLTKYTYIFTKENSSLILKELEKES